MVYIYTSLAFVYHIHMCIAYGMLLTCYWIAIILLCQEPVAEEKKETAKPLVAGDMVEVVNEFGTNSKTVVQLSKGQVGNVIKIDNVGDAYIDFGEGFGKQWVTLLHFKCSF